MANEIVVPIRFLLDTADLKKAAEGLGAIERAAGELARTGKVSFENLTFSVKDLNLGLRALENAFESATSDEARRGFAAQAAQVQALRTEVLASAGAMHTFGGSNKQAQTFLIDLGRTVNDLQVGAFGGLQMALIGISNNFESLIVGAKSLRTTGLQGLVAALTGPAGIVLALQTAITVGVLFGDKIAEAFNKGAKAAEEARARMRKAFGDFPFDFRGANDAQAALDRIGRQLGPLGNQIADLQRRRAALEDARVSTPNALSNMSSVRMAPVTRPFTQEEQRQYDDLQRAIDALTPRFEKLQAAALAVNNEIVTLRQNEAVAGVFAEFGIRAADADGSLQGLRKAFAGLAQELEGLRAAVTLGLLTPLEGAEAQASALRTALFEALNTSGGQITGAIRDLKAQLDATVDSALELRALSMNGGAVRASDFAPVGKSGSVALLDSQMAADFGVTREGIDTLIEPVERLDLSAVREQLLETSAAFVDFGATVASGIQTAVTAFSEFLAAGDTFGAALGKSLLLGLGQLAKQVGGLLIGFGVAGLSLRKLLTNPVAAIAAGTALVALGAAATAAVGGAVSRATGGATGVGVSKVAAGIIVPGQQAGGERNVQRTQVEIFVRDRFLMAREVAEANRVVGRATGRGT